MRIAIETYAGWQPKDVNGEKCGWDITFRRGAVVHHVEVKGVSGQRPRVLLTRNEVAVARRDPCWRLLVVTRVLVAPQAHVFEPDSVLKSVDAYMYVTDLD